MPRLPFAPLALSLSAAFAPGQCPDPIWQPVGAGSNGEVLTLANLPNGDLVAGGHFTTMGGIAANHIARWDGTAWNALGGGVSGGVLGQHVNAVGVLPNGDVIAGGDFGAAGGVAVAGLARWDGGNWTAFGPAAGPGAIRWVYALRVLSNGDVAVSYHDVATGTYSLWRWNGSAWNTLGVFSGNVTGIAELANGDLVVGGSFASVAGVPAANVARWDGAAWSALGAGTSAGVRTVTGLPDGDVVAVGTFDLAGGVSAARVARWDGTAWSAMGGGLVGAFPASVLATSSGLVLVGGAMGGGIGNLLRRWDGTDWAPLASGIVSPGAPGDRVAALLERPNGDLAAGGQLSLVGGATDIGLRTPCAFSAVVSGTGCPSSGGANTLSVLSPPLADCTFRALGEGLPTSALVIAATSLTPIPQGAAPLDLLLPPQGQPGCDVLVVPDILTASLTSTGTAISAIPLPNMPPLIGLTIYHQMVSIEIDAMLNWLAITSTNALQLTIGAP